MYTYSKFEIRVVFLGCMLYDVSTIIISWNQYNNRDDYLLLLNSNSQIFIFRIIFRIKYFIIIFWMIDDDTIIYEFIKYKLHNHSIYILIL